MLITKAIKNTWRCSPRNSIFSYRYISSSAFTVINPTKPLQTYITEHADKLSFKPSSLIIAVTSELSPHLSDLISEKNNGGQVIGLSCDAIPPASQRNALSACFLGSPAIVEDANPLADGLSHRRTERGVTVGRVNWALSSSFFSIDIGGSLQRPSTSLILPTANTIFNTGHETTMLYRENDDISPLLSSLKIRIHSINGSTSTTLPSKSLICPLVPIARPEMTITKAVDNMIKTIDNTSAAHFLESSKELMSPGKLSSDEHKAPRKVFAEIISMKTGKMDRYEVIAGGGGEWSPRSSMLVLEPRASLTAGDKISFYFAKPIHNSGDYGETAELTTAVQSIETQSETAFVLECSPVVESLDEAAMVPYHSDVIIPNVFGLSSEQGFLLDDLKHSVNSEIAVLN